MPPAPQHGAGPGLPTTARGGLLPRTDGRRDAFGSERPAKRVWRGLEQIQYYLRRRPGASLTGGHWDQVRGQRKGPHGRGVPRRGTAKPRPHGPWAQLWWVTGQGQRGRQEAWAVGGQLGGGGVPLYQTLPASPPPSPGAGLPPYLPPNGSQPWSAQGRSSVNAG